MFNGKSFGILCAEESSGMSLSFLSVAAAVALPVYCVQQGLIKSKQPLGLSLQLSNVIALQLGDHHRSMFGSGIFRQIRKTRNILSSHANGRNSWDSCEVVRSLICELSFPLSLHQLITMSNCICLY